MDIQELLFELPEHLQYLQRIKLTFYQSPTSPATLRIQREMLWLWKIFEGAHLGRGCHKSGRGGLEFLEEAIQVLKLEFRF
jgi:hypothetical protein